MKGHGLVFLLAALLLSACQVIPGNLLINDNIVLTDGDEQEAFLPGAYQSNIRLNSKKRFTLTIKRDNGDESSFEFKIPKGVDIPRNNGELSLTAEQVEQPYDVHGVVKTNVTRSESRYDNESCQEQRPYTVCRNDPRGGTTCHTEYRTYYGWRDVRYHLRTEEKNFTLDLLDGESALASFNGTRREAQRMYEYTGPCR